MAMEHLKEWKEKISQPFWGLSEEDALKALVSSRDGLIEEEATKRAQIFGRNEISERMRFTKIKILLSQFESPLILILLIAAFISAYLQDWIDMFVIFAAVTINTGLGFYQENKAEEVLRILKSYVRVRARVRRNGREREIDATELVPGDIIRVSQGDRVPADGRIILSNNLMADEAILTGEALPVHKSAPSVAENSLLGDRSSMVFGGTLIVDGFADIAITAIGEFTEFGKIAALIGSKREGRTPLQRALSRFAFRVGALLVALVIIMFWFGLQTGYNLLEMFLISVAVAVSAVPEGLPIALTVILAVGVERLGKKRGIVRKLLAAETLGSTDVILTDKTGTLTQAKMELADVVLFNKESKENLLRDALMNTDVFIENPDDSVPSWKVRGKPLEVALVQGAAAQGVLLNDAKQRAAIVDFLPFNSARKFSASILKQGAHKKILILGAPEIVVQFCDVEQKEREHILKEISRLAFGGGRLVGIASRFLQDGHDKIIVPDSAKQPPAQFSGNSFHGIFVFRDPLRSGVKDAIARIGNAGVRTIMVTGDHVGTALSVARELNIAQSENEVMNGEEMSRIPLVQLKGALERVKVFARVTPEQKLLLTNLYRERGAIVAVTGDGINDAPALSRADIGVALGSGTDVTKNQADLVLLDDNFETLVSAIEEGRTILDNIRKVIVYLLSDSLDELLLIGGSLIAGLALPLNAIQILFVNFFSDSFPALAFAFERGVDGFSDAPRKPDKNLFDKKVRFLILGIGVFTSSFLFALYYALLQLNYDSLIVRTFIFASFSSYTLFLALSLRSLEKSIFSYNIFENRYLIYGIGFGLLLTLAAVYAPWLQNILGTVSLPPFWLLGVLLIGIFNIALVEFSKWLFRKNIL